MFQHESQSHTHTHTDCPNYWNQWLAINTNQPACMSCQCVFTSSFTKHKCETWMRISVSLHIVCLFEFVHNEKKPTPRPCCTHDPQSTWSTGSLKSLQISAHKNVVLLITFLATATAQPPTSPHHDGNRPTTDTHTYMHTLSAHFFCLYRAVIRGLDLGWHPTGAWVLTSGFVQA